MTDIEAKALALVNGVRTERCGVYTHYTRLRRDHDDGHEALCRAIEQHEAFKQEVSDVAETLTTNYRQSFLRKYLGHFIISKPKPDELVEVWGDLFEKSYNLDQFCAALEARGFEIREKGQ
jgi:hypothetical protein